MKYGGKPMDCGLFTIQPPELMYVQYLPVKMAGSWDIRIPKNLMPFWSMVAAALLHGVPDDYIYLTAKRMYVPAGTTGNREGWHSDGFGTNDINYLWYDSVATEFCVQPFNLSDDHALSLIEMAEQADPANIITYPHCHLLRLDSGVIHRPGISTEGGFRTFVKISVSPDKYNLEGNAHNYLFDYRWDMQPRQEYRNHPQPGNPS